LLPVPCQLTFIWYYFFAGQDLGLVHHPEEAAEPRGEGGRVHGAEPGDGQTEEKLPGTA